MTRVFEYVLALAALTVMTVPFEVDSFAPVPLHSAAATINAGYVHRAALQLLRIVDRKVTTHHTYIKRGMMMTLKK